MNLYNKDLELHVPFLLVLDIINDLSHETLQNSNPYERLN